MQFFPADISGPAGDIVSTVFGSAADSVSAFSNAATAMGSSFQDIFASLSSYNENNTLGVPLTIRSSRDDRSFFKSDEFAHLKGKLAECGISEKILDEYFEHMSAAKDSPTIAQMRSAVSELMSGGQGADLDKQEFLRLSAALGRLGFSTEEVGGFKQMMLHGDSLGMLRQIKEKVKTLAEKDTEVEISKEELDLLTRACALPDDYSARISSALSALAPESVTRIPLNKTTFNQLFGSPVTALEMREAEIARLGENIDAAIESMLAYRNSKSNEPVSDMRGSALAERTETMARILAVMTGGDNEEQEENSTGHLMPGAESGKIGRKEDIVASLADNKMTSRPVKEERAAEMQDSIRGKALAQNSRPEAEAGAEAGAERAKAQIERAPVENILRETANRSEDKARQDLPGGQNRSGSDTRTGEAVFSSRVQESSGVVFGLFGQTENSSASARNLETARSETYHTRIFEQIEHGIVKNASDGSKQIVLRLDPPELGKLTLSLSVAQGEVKALIRTDSTATTQAVSEQLVQLKQSLEEQGFKVTNLEVETRAQDHAGTDQWSGSDQHNQERELLEQSRFMRLARARAREGETLAQSMQDMEHPASLSASGLHIIA